MRKNKTYSQQKKYYDEDNEYLMLADIFIYWYDCNTDCSKKQIVETYRECNRECKMQIIDELMQLSYVSDYRRVVEKIIMWLMFTK